MISVSPSQMNTALVSVPFPSGFTILGYQTTEDARAYHAGDRTLFDEIEEWLEENLPDNQAMVAVNEFHATLRVAIPDAVDAVTFKLRWSDVILD